MKKRFPLILGSGGLGWGGDGKQLYASQVKKWREGRASEAKKEQPG